MRRLVCQSAPPASAPEPQSIAKIVLVVDVIVMIAVGTFHPDTTTPDRVGLGLLFGCSAGLAIATAMSLAVLAGSQLVATLCLLRQIVAVDTISAIEMDGPALIARFLNGKKLDLTWSLPRNPERRAETIAGYQRMLREGKHSDSPATRDRIRSYPFVAGIAVVAASGIGSVALTLLVRLVMHGQILG